MVHRVIGRMDGQTSGPLVVATAALHGNEPAGVHALEAAFSMLADTPDLHFKGTFIGLIGNLHAFVTQSRFMERDFNRIWTPHHLETVLQHAGDKLHGEDLELLHLYQAIHTVIHTRMPERVFFLDLHTTSASGGIFCIPTDEKESLRFAKALHAPVILNLFDRVEGTLLRFAAEGHFSTEIPPQHICGAAYEAGQHEDPMSVSRSLSAILNTLHYAGCIADIHLRSPEETILQKSFAELPRVTRLIHAHHIKPGDTFRMRPGYVNFQAVEAGEHLADDVHGPILSPFSGLILMPLYQPQGSDGFFLVKEEEKR